MLEILKQPRWLSPSALRVYENMPNTFYLNRMAPNPLPYDPQGPSAGVGSAFDAYVKIYLIEKGKVALTSEELRQRMLKDMWYTRDLYTDSSLEDVMLSSVEKQNVEHALPMGKVLLEKYKRNGLESMQWNDLEIHRKHTLFYGKPGSIPLFMKLDASVIDSEFDRPVPFDWKVSGYGSSMSPPPGYRMLYDGGVPMGCHKNYRENCPMQEINSTWSVQLCTYGWGIGIPFGTEFPAYIDNLVMRKVKDSDPIEYKIRVARYRGIITKSYQIELADRYNAAWHGLLTGEILKRIPEHRKFVELLKQHEHWFNFTY